MFNPQNPYNELPLLPPDFNLESVDILKAVNRANLALASLNKAASALPNPLLLLNSLSMKEAVASSGIENIHTTTAEALRAEVLPEKEILIAQKETLHYKNALMKGYDLLLKQEFLHTNSFVQIQSILEPNKPGLRKIPGTKIANSKTGETIYTPPAGLNVIQDKLKNFENFFNLQDVDPDPLVKTALLHYQFEAIHPFLDGNGRTGRILLVLHLVLTKKIDLPILFISGYLLDNRSEYYRLLLGVTKKRAWKEWILYILQGMEKQSKDTEYTVSQIKKEMEKTEKLILKKAKAIHSEALINFLFTNPFYTQKSIMENMRIHRNTASKYLNTLHKIGLLKKTAHKKTVIYYNQPFLRIFS